MSDLLHVLPDFAVDAHAHILPSLEKSHLSLSDLLTLDAVDVAKKASVPAAEVRKFTDAVLKALHGQLGLFDGSVDTDGQSPATGKAQPSLACNGLALAESWKTISTLDSELDAALGGGLPTGYLTEITGESGAGKTQFLLSLLLSVQLAPPHGLNRSALYISTESPLQTTRLSQILRCHPALSALPPSAKPSLSRVLSIHTPDLESQDHILRYQVPVALRRHNAGLLVIDSIAANYRAEFARPSKPASGSGSGSSTRGAAMAKRSQQLVQLGALLRDLARTHNIAVVVANQVSDRFAPAAAATAPAGPPPDPFTLDHQQRWFTGWGDIPPGSLSSSVRSQQSLKSPSLGLVWANQISCRIALLKEAVYARPETLLRRAEARADNDDDDGANGGEMELVRWRRWMKIVFAPWVAGHDGEMGVEYEIVEGGIRSLGGRPKGEGGEGGEGGSKCG